MIHPLRKLYKELPTVKELSTNKKVNSYMFHPKGTYVLIGASRHNQYQTSLKVDMWNIPYNVDPNSKGFIQFKKEFDSYLDKIYTEVNDGKRKGIGMNTIFSYPNAGTYNTVDVMAQEEEEWFEKLWNLCSTEENLIKFDI